MTVPVEYAHLIIDSHCCFNWPLFLDWCHGPSSNSANMAPRRRCQTKGKTLKLTITPDELKINTYLLIDCDRGRVFNLTSTYWLHNIKAMVAAALQHWHHRAPGIRYQINVNIYVRADDISTLLCVICTLLLVTTEVRVEATFVFFFAEALRG